MSASTGDKFTATRNAARPNSATVSSARAAGATTLACDDLTGWPTVSKVHFVTYQVDSNNDPISSTQLDCQGIVSGNNITSFSVIDGSDIGNSVGDIVEMLPTAAWGEDLYKGLIEEHNRDGTHGDITTDSIATNSGGSVDFSESPLATTDVADGAITPAKRSGGFKVGSFTFSASTGNQSVTGLGFVPKLVEFYWDIGTGATTAIGADGFMDENGNQFARFWGADGTNAARNSFTDACIVTGTHTSSTPNRKASFVSLDADGFTINISSSSGTTPIVYKAFG